MLFDAGASEFVKVFRMFQKLALWIFWHLPIAVCNARIALKQAATSYYQALVESRRFDVAGIVIYNEIYSRKYEILLSLHRVEPQIHGIAGKL
jgi:hypothetical protein